MEWYQWLTWGSLAVGTTLIGLPMTYRVVWRVYRDLYEQWITQRRDKLTLSHIDEQNRLHAIRHLERDENGNLGVTMDVNGNYRNLDTGEVFTQLATLYLDPIRAQMDAMYKMLLAMRGVGAGNAGKLNDLAANARPALNWGHTTLGTLLAKYDFKPRLHNVLIGEYADESGAIRPLTLDIPKAVHVLCTGASGLGKSTLLEAIALQLATIEGVQLAAVDYGSGTFDRLEPVLKWQIADTPGLAVALFIELIKLANQRKEAYKQAGRVRSLAQFNAITGLDLPFVTCFVDETSALLEHDGTKDKLIELARMGRKYGIGLILGGTDFKATTLPTEARSNCQARLAFWLEPGLSRSLLNSDEAAELGQVGDIVAKRPGQIGTVKGHTPDVTDIDYTRLELDGRPPAPLEPVDDDPPSPGGLDGDQVDEIMDRHYAGEKPTPIARAVFGYANSRTVELVKAVISEYDNDDNDNDYDPGLG